MQHMFSMLGDFVDMPYRFHSPKLSFHFETSILDSFTIHSDVFLSIHRIRLSMNPMCSTHSVGSFAYDEHIKVPYSLMISALHILSLQ